ncbi:MAG: tyrosine-type recombinase/integrase, partial [Chloroflexota bacterium]
GTITIEQCLARVRGQWNVDPPKTAAGERTIPIPRRAIAALRRQLHWRAEQRLRRGPEWEGSGFVFCGLSGQPLGPTYIAKAMRREALKLSMEPVTPHGLRHFHISWLLEAGRPLAEVSERVGHSDPSVTHRVYTHRTQKGGSESAAALDRALGE